MRALLVQMLKCLRLPRLLVVSDSEDPVTPHTSAEEAESQSPHRQLPQRISEEDIIPPDTPFDMMPDMHTVMHDEDESRERLFKLANMPSQPSCGLHSKKRRRGKMPECGASAGYQLARQSTTRVYCCGACGAWLVRPQDLLKETEHAAQIALDDCEVTLCTEHADVREAEARDVQTDAWLYKIVGVRCKKCDVFVGVKLQSMEMRPDALRQGGPSPSPFENSLLYEAHGVRASPPSPRWLSAVASNASGAKGGVGEPLASSADALRTVSPTATSSLSSSRPSTPTTPSTPPTPVMIAARAPTTPTELPPLPTELPPLPSMAYSSVWGNVPTVGEEGVDDDAHVSAPTDEEVAAMSLAAAVAAAEERALAPLAVGQIYLGTRYLRLTDAHSNAPVAPLVPLLCRTCDAPLSYTDQLLCTRRRWGFDGPPEPACFVNSLISQNVQVRTPFDLVSELTPIHKTPASRRMSLTWISSRCGFPA